MAAARSSSASEKAKVHPHLQGMFAPVLEETHAQGLPVSRGRLPPDLVGQFCRVGPNAQFEPKASTYHMFAGDGMLHCVRVDGRSQRADYVNRWVRTPKFLAERSAGRLSRPPFEGEDYSKRIGGLANTALVFHAGKLLALEEGHLPYALGLLKDGDVAMRGFENFGGKLGHAFTAHPKVDPSTGEMMFFGYDVLRKPYCTYGVVDSTGTLTTSLPISYDKPVMMHDCAITARHSIILYLPLVFRTGRGAVDEGTTSRQPFFLDRSEPSRFAIFPRHAKSADDIVWFEYPTASYGYHTANTWEDGDTIHMVHVTDDEFDFGKNGVDSDLKLVRWSFHLPTRRVSRVTLLDRQVEFPIMNPLLVGRSSKFVYVQLFGEDKRLPEAERPQLRRYKAEHVAKGYLWGISKVDVVEGRECGRIIFGEDVLGTECSFAPRAGATAEDAGYLVLFLHDCAAGQSSFAVYDAESMSPEPLCSLAIPARVPFGFHALWVPEAQLLQQPSLELLAAAPHREGLHRRPPPPAAKL